MQNILSFLISRKLSLVKSEIVLRWNGCQWVVHNHNLQDNDYYYGHYFFSYEEAEKYFYDRVRSYREDEIRSITNEIKVIPVL